MVNHFSVSVCILFEGQIYFLISVGDSFCTPVQKLGILWKNSRPTSTCCLLIIDSPKMKKILAKIALSSLNFHHMNVNVCQSLIFKHLFLLFVTVGGKQPKLPDDSGFSRHSLASECRLWLCSQSQDEECVYGSCYGFTRLFITHGTVSQPTYVHCH